MSGGWFGRSGAPGTVMQTGVFSLDEINEAKNRRAWWEDSYWGNVTALMHLDGTNGSTTFTELTGKRTVTRGGSAQISTAQSRFGGASLRTAKATADYLKFDASADWNFGAGDFTVEFWVYKNSDAGNGTNTRLFQLADSDVVSGFSLCDNRPGGGFGIDLSSDGGSWNLTANLMAGTLPLATWKHIAVERYGANLTVYVDGAVGCTRALGTTALYWSAAQQPVLGGQSGNNRSFDGWSDEFRSTKGYARYKGTFTPATSPFQSI